MNEIDHSFGLLLGEFLDKAVVAMSEVATAAEVFINKSSEISTEFQHPADKTRIEMMTNFPAKLISTKPPSSHSKQNKIKSPKIKKTEKREASKVFKTEERKLESEKQEASLSSEPESDESSNELFATQKTGKAAGLSTKHYIINEAEDDDAEEEEEENNYDIYSSTSYSDF